MGAEEGNCSLDNEFHEGQDRYVGVVCLQNAALRLSDGDVIETTDLDLARAIMLCGGIGLGGLLIYAALFGHAGQPTMSISYCFVAPVTSP